MKSTPFTVGLLALALHAQAQEPIKDRSRVPATAHSEGSVEEGTLRALAHITKRIQILFDRTLRLIDRFPTMPSVDRKSLTGVIDELAGMLRENASALRRGDITLT